MPTSRISNKYQFQINTNFKFVSLIIFSLSLITYLSVKALTMGDHLPLTFAQTPKEKARQDYTFQFTKYREAQEKYSTAQAAYLSFQTATAKNDAYLKAKEFLSQTDSLYLSYIALVTEYGNSMDWQRTSLSKDKINTLEETEVSYFQTHQKQISQTATLEELPPLTQELKNHIEKSLSLKINKILATFEVAETESTFNEFSELSQTVRNKIASQSRSEETNSILMNWTSEIENIRKSSEVLKNQSIEKFNQKPQDTLEQGDLEEITKFTQEAKSQLKKSKPLFEEVARIL